MVNIKSNLLWEILDYTIQIIDDLVKITDFYIDQKNADYQYPVGGHIRHLIDHYNSLLKSTDGTVNYDLRERDVEIEKYPQKAQKSLKDLIPFIEQIKCQDLNRPLLICASAGKAGNFEFKAQSSFAREMLFLNSHTVHHFAMIKSHCVSLGMQLDENFGVAPSTVAYKNTQLKE